MNTIIPFRVSHIETVQFAIFPDEYLNGTEVTVDTSCGFNVKTDLSQIRNLISVKYSQNGHLLLVAQVACYFGISPESIEEIKTAGVIPAEFLRYIGAVSIGVIRGVIHSKTEGTVLNPVVLPPVDMDLMVDSDLNL